MSIDPRRNSARSAVDWAQVDGGEYAVRIGRGVCGWANQVIPGNVQVVLPLATCPQLIYNIAEGRRVMVAQYCYAVETASDSCEFEFGYTDAADGAGTFHPMGPLKNVFTGAAITGRVSFDQDIAPPIVISHGAGARSITFRVTANDASCVITVGWHGWWEEE